MSLTARVPPAPVNCMVFVCGISNPLEILRVLPDKMSTFDDPVCSRFCTTALFSTSSFPVLSTSGIETFATVAIPSNFSTLSGASSTNFPVFAKVPPPERVKVFAPSFKSPPE